MPRLDRRIASRRPSRPTRRRGLPAWFLLPLASILIHAGPGRSAPSSRPPHEALFTESFDAGLDRWRFPLGEGYRVVATGDPVHGRALELATRSLPTYALIRGSEGWRDVRIEGSFDFPRSGASFLGFIYRYRDDGRRIDFGSAYVKSDGSYAQANPRYDTNVARALYPELRVALSGERAVRPGIWTPFALEVVGSNAHLYVGDLTRPCLTFAWQGPQRGAFGFEPRRPGAPVWVDDLRVTAIEAFTYRGRPIPDPPYDRSHLVTSWEVLGPLTRTAATLETGDAAGGAGVEDDGRTLHWRPLEADARGAVVTASVVELREARRVAYLRTALRAERAGPVTLELATTDDLALWLDGRFLGFAPRQDRAWWDAGVDPEHRPVRARVNLRQGENHLLVRVIGGVYAAAGFFLRVRARAGRSAGHDVSGTPPLPW